MTEPLKTLVTGASGFVGRHVVEAVAGIGLSPFPLVRQGSSVEHLTRYQENLVRADLRDPEALRRAVEGMDLVIHVAGLTRAKSLNEFLEVNARGVERLAAACRMQRTSPKRLVFVSSLAASGSATSESPRREDDVCRPCTPYGVSKLRGEESLREVADHALPWTIVRPPIVYGPGERDLLSIFRMSKRGCVPIVGRAPKHYSVVFAPDLARVMVELALDPRAAGEIYHIAEPAVYTGRELVEIIGRSVRGKAPWTPRMPHAVVRLLAAGGSVAQTVLRRPPMLNLGKLPEILAPGWVCSSEKVSRLLGRTPCPTGLAEGSQETAAWYRAEGWL